MYCSLTASWDKTISKYKIKYGHKLHKLCLRLKKRNSFFLLLVLAYFLIKLVYIMNWFTYCLILSYKVIWKFIQNFKNTNHFTDSFSILQLGRISLLLVVHYAKCLFLCLVIFCYRINILRINSLTCQRLKIIKYFIPLFFFPYTEQAWLQIAKRLCLNTRIII